MTEQGAESETWHEWHKVRSWQGWEVASLEPDDGYPIVAIAKTEEYADQIIADHDAASTNLPTGQAGAAQVCKHRWLAVRARGVKSDLQNSEEEATVFEVCTHDCGAIRMGNTVYWPESTNAAQAARAEAAREVVCPCATGERCVNTCPCGFNGMSGVCKVKGCPTMAALSRHTLERRATEAETALGVVKGQRDAAVTLLTGIRNELLGQIIAPEARYLALGREWSGLITEALSNLTTTQPGESA